MGLSDGILQGLADKSQRIESYLKATRFLLDCKTAALSVSPAAWAKIEDGLFLVDEP